MNEEKENLILRDLLHSTARQFTPEELEKIRSEAAYIKFTDEGIELSQGMKDLLSDMFQKYV